jgi:hypothetical protein
MTTLAESKMHDPFASWRGVATNTGMFNEMEGCPNAKSVKSVVWCCFDPRRDAAENWTNDKCLSPGKGRLGSQSLCIGLRLHQARSEAAQSSLSP